MVEKKQQTVQHSLESKKKKEEELLEEPPPKTIPVNESFTAAFQSVMKSNSVEDLASGFSVLSKLLHSLQTIEKRANAHGVERSEQRKYRTIFSQNSAVNNHLLSLGGNIEDLIMAIGFTPVELGNPDLKPNFVFYGDCTEDFITLRKHTETIDSALETCKVAMQRQNTANSLPVTKKRSLSNLESSVASHFATKREKVSETKEIQLPKEIQEKVQQFFSKGKQKSNESDVNKQESDQQEKKS